MLPLHRVKLPVHARDSGMVLLEQACAVRQNIPIP
jgi:hypothetical protein